MFLYTTLKVVRTRVKCVLIYNIEGGQNKSKVCPYIPRTRVKYVLIYSEQE